MLDLKVLYDILKKEWVSLLNEVSSKKVRSVFNIKIGELFHSKEFVSVDKPPHIICFYSVKIKTFLETDREILEISYINLTTNENCVRTMFHCEEDLRMFLDVNIISLHN